VCEPQPGVCVNRSKVRVTRNQVGLDVDPLAHELAGARIRSHAQATLSIHLIRSNFRCAAHHHVSALALLLFASAFVMVPTLSIHLIRSNFRCAALHHVSALALLLFASAFVMVPTLSIHLIRSNFRCAALHHVSALALLLFASAFVMVPPCSRCVSENGFRGSGAGSLAALIERAPRTLSISRERGRFHARNTDAFVEVSARRCELGGAHSYISCVIRNTARLRYAPSHQGVEEDWLRPSPEARNCAAAACPAGKTVWASRFHARNIDAFWDGVGEAGTWARCWRG
jgi:hypothetical protein